MRIALMILLLWLAGASYAQPPGDSGSEQPSAEQRANGAQRSPSELVALDRIADELEKARVEQRDPHGDEKNQRERRDVIAQENMAYWAGAMFWAIIGQTVIAVFALAALIYTVRQTNKGLGEARAANEIARDTAWRQLRAYLTTEDHDIINVFRGGATELRLKLYNRGQTPAYDVVIWSIVTGTQGDPDILKVKQRGDDWQTSRAVLGPGQWVLHSNDCQAPLGDEAYIAIATGDVKLVFAGVVSYRDVFGKRHFTTFKQFYPGVGNWQDTAGDLLACGKGNVSS